MSENEEHENPSNVVLEEGMGGIEETATSPEVVPEEGMSENKENTMGDADVEHVLPENAMTETEETGNDTATSNGVVLDERENENENENEEPKPRDVVQDLVNQGVSVKQLLEFYGSHTKELRSEAYMWSYLRPDVVEEKIKRGFSQAQLRDYERQSQGQLSEIQEIQDATLYKVSRPTTEVVRNIVCPQTRYLAHPSKVEIKAAALSATGEQKKVSCTTSCYMQSDFMKQRGGGQRATKLVSHAWKSGFLSTVTSILLDASEWLPDVLQNFEDSTYIRNTDLSCMLAADRLLKDLSPDKLANKYWLCIFAVNQHHTVCGDCWTCHELPKWLDNPKIHIQANRCLLCDEIKPYPCSCGSTKWGPQDEDCEIDKFSLVLAEMEEVVVALDGTFSAFTRMWCVSEIAEASQKVPVVFRMSKNDLTEVVPQVRMNQDLAREKKPPIRANALVRSSAVLMDSVEFCEVTGSFDRDRILGEVHQVDGGTAEYDVFVNSVILMHFGNFEALAGIPEGFASQAFGQLVNMNSRFDTELMAIDPLQGFDKLRNLNSLDLDFHDCKNIRDLGPLQALEELMNLCSLRLNFVGCEKLVDISSLQGLGKLSKLKKVEMDFTNCKKLMDINPIFGLEGLQLTELSLWFSFCNLIHDITFMSCLEEMTTLTRLTLDFAECHPDDLAVLKKLELLSNLEFQKLNFGHCKRLVFLSPMVGYWKLTNITEVKWNFNFCEKIADLGPLQFAFSDKQKKLSSISLDFSHCTKLANIFPLKSLGQPRNLAHLNLAFNFCEQLQDISPLQYLEMMKNLVSLNLEFAHCRKLEDLECLKNLELMPKLSSLCLSFVGCGKLRDISPLQCMENMGELSSVNFDFGHCSKLSDIKALESLGKLSKLEDLSLDFIFCVELSDISPLQALRKLNNLNNLNLDFKRCDKLRDISSLAPKGPLGKDLGNELSANTMKIRLADGSKFDSMKFVPGMPIFNLW